MRQLITCMKNLALRLPSTSIYASVEWKLKKFWQKYRAYLKSSISLFFFFHLSNTTLLPHISLLAPTFPPLSSRFFPRSFFFLLLSARKITVRKWWKLKKKKKNEKRFLWKHLLCLIESNFSMKATLSSSP